MFGNGVKEGVDMVEDEDEEEEIVEEILGRMMIRGKIWMEWKNVEV